LESSEIAAWCTCMASMASTINEQRLGKTGVGISFGSISLSRSDPIEPLFYNEY